MPNGQKRSGSLLQPQQRHDSVSDDLQHPDAAPNRIDPTGIVIPSRETTRRQIERGHKSRPTLTSGSRSPKTQDLTYYPAYCHQASPTWFEWVKLTACDIHTRLQTRDGYQHSWLAEYQYRRDAPQLMFYLNHPIQFVQVVGVVIGFDEYFERFWLFTIDDSSGMTVDVVCQKPTKEKTDILKRLNAIPNGQKVGEKEDEDEDEEEKEVLRLSALVADAVEIGAVLQVKGVVTLFQRHKPDCALDNFGNRTSGCQIKEAPVRQISLQRLTRVADTNQELSIIAARTHFHNAVLSKPWTVSRKEQHKLHKQALGETEHVRKKARRLAERKQRVGEEERKVEEAIQQEWCVEEKERERSAEMARQAGLRLKESLARREDQATKSTGLESSLSVVADEQNRTGNIKRRDRKRTKQRKENASDARANRVLERLDTTNDSFAALDSEKSALLKAAFG